MSCVWLGDQDIGAFASTGTSVAHCPSSNLKLGSGVAPVIRMLRKGVKVELGCDGGPSNDAYDMVRRVRRDSRPGRPLEDRFLRSDILFAWS